MPDTKWIAACVYMPKQSEISAKLATGSSSAQAVINVRLVKGPNILSQAVVSYPKAASLSQRNLGLISSAVACATRSAVAKAARL